MFWIPVESDEEPVIPDNFGLYASPNPFNSETRIILDLPDVITDAQLSVYDLMGRRVRHWPKSAMSPLRHEIFWDGRDDNGQVLTSGIYLLRLNSPQKVLTAKTVLVR